MLYVTRIRDLSLYCREINATLQTRVINLFQIKCVFEIFYTIISESLNCILAQEKGINFKRQNWKLSRALV